MTAIPIQLRLDLEERTVAVTCTVIAPDPHDTRRDSDLWIVRCTPLGLRIAAARIELALGAMLRALATWLVNSRHLIAAVEG